MTRRFVLLLFVLANFCRSYSQTLEAHYKISKEVNADVGDGSMHKLGTLTYDGTLYQKGADVIFFKKPLFLSDYPDGLLKYETGPGKVFMVAVSTDSVQGIFYRNFDTLRIRYRADLPAGKSINFTARFKRGQIKWAFLPDTKEINGLKCQKAQFINSNDKVQWVVWFCADIPTDGGPDGISDLPGLVVEGKNEITNEVFTLMSYKTNGNVSSSVFWPSEFMKPFKGNS